MSAESSVYDKLKPSSKKPRNSIVAIVAFLIAISGVILFVLVAQRSSLRILGFESDHRIVTVFSGGIATFCLALCTAYAIEVSFRGYNKSSLRMLLNFDRQIRYDLVWALAPWLPIYASIAYFMTFGLDSVQWPWMTYVRNSFPIAAITIYPLQLVVFVLVSSFLQYWQHRTLHKIPILWETHKFHHSAEQMTTLSLMRETPFTSFIGGVLITIPAAIAGVYVFPEEPTSIDYSTLVVYLFYQSFNQLNQFLIHSNLNISYGWFGRYFIVSPANHRVHHSILPEHYDKNFSVSLVIWDRLFDTYVEGVDPLSQDCPVGYVGNIYNKNRWIVIDYFLPTYAFFAAIYSTITRKVRAKRGGTKH